MESCFVRPATASELPPCETILADSVLGTYFDPPLAAQILAGAQAEGSLFVAVAGGEVAGFYVHVPRGSFLVFSYLHLLAVRSTRRGQGVGGQLLGHLEASALAAPGYPNRPKIFLLVSAQNPRALRFYERHGYQRKATIDDMFGDGDTELLMMKDLGNKPQAG
jgi:ribosomal protein S18 acetylase RimI-like enzyme